MREGIEGVGKWRNVWAKGGICVIDLRGMDAPGDPMWYVISLNGEVISTNCYTRLLYLLYFTRLNAVYHTPSIVYLWMGVVNWRTRKRPARKCSWQSHRYRAPQYLQHDRSYSDSLNDVQWRLYSERFDC